MSRLDGHAGDPGAQAPHDWVAPFGRVSLNQQIEEVTYELAQRGKVYPRIAARSPHKARELDYHVKRMAAVRRTLGWLGEHEELVRAIANENLIARADVREALKRAASALRKYERGRLGLDLAKDTAQALEALLEQEPSE